MNKYAELFNHLVNKTIKTFESNLTEKVITITFTDDTYIKIIVYDDVEGIPTNHDATYTFQWNWLPEIHDKIISKDRYVSNNIHQKNSASMHRYFGTDRIEDNCSINLKQDKFGNPT